LGILSEDDCRSSLILSSGFVLKDKRMSKFIQLLFLLILLKLFAPEIFALVFDIFGYMLSLLSELFGSLQGGSIESGVFTDFGL
jgi:hypothetical protein